MKKRWIILLVLAICLLVFTWCGAVGCLVFCSLIGNGGGLAGDKVALIRIEGPISASGVGGGLIPSVGTSSEDVVKMLVKADKDSSVRAILLRINSPGGTAAAGEEVYAQVRKTKKPVVVSIADIGTSAAYEIASAADKIVANGSSSVGSIGVIYIIPNYQGLYEKLGIKYIFITQGEYKDIGNPTRPITEQEREILAGQAEIAYKRFIANVARGRPNLSKRQVEELATGLDWLGVEAYDKGLIDEIGNYQDAVDLSAKLGKIEGKPKVIEYGVSTFFESLGQVLRERPNLLDLILLRGIQLFPSQNQIENK